jgi:hypothetical protein
MGVPGYCVDVGKHPQMHPRTRIPPTYWPLCPHLAPQFQEPGRKEGLLGLVSPTVQFYIQRCERWRHTNTDVLFRRPCLEACAYCPESWMPGILKLFVITAAAMDGWDHTALRGQQLYGGDVGPILQIWRLESIPSERTLVAAVPSTRVTGRDGNPL